MDRKTIEEIKASDPYFEEIKTKSTFKFDFVLWFYRLLKNWYLFLITIPLFIGIAKLENQSWIPYYSVNAMIMLEARGNAGISASMDMGTVLRNSRNLTIVLSSYEMTERTVNALPQYMHVDYYRVDRFKTINLYSTKPVKIDTIYSVADEWYNREFNIAPLDDEHCRIYYDANVDAGIEAYSIKVPYDKIIEDKEKFKIRVSKTEQYTSDFLPFSFKLLNKASLMGMFLGRVSPVADEKSNMMNISMGGPVPERDVDFLNELLSQFQNYNLHLKNQRADLTISFIDRQLKIINDSLRLSRESLDEFQRFTGVYEITSTALRGETMSADAEKAELATIEKTLLLLTQTVTEGILGDKELVLPLGFIAEGKLGQLNSYVDSYNSLLKAYKNMGVKNPMYEKKVNEVNEARANILEYLQLQQNELQRRKDMLVKKYEVLDLKIENLPPQERDLVMYEREYKTYESYDQYLRQRRNEAQLLKESNVPDNEIWEAPRQAGAPFNSGILSQNIMSHLMYALILPLIFIVLKEEVLNFTIASKEECEKISGMVVIATIENVGKKIRKGVVLVKNYPKSSFAESFRNMRIRIEYLALRENKITTLITSTEPADGKTFIATNIASVYQLMGKNVVIVDLDLRRPSVGKTLAVEYQRGVSNYLIGQISLEEATISHPDYGFDIIPAGTLPPNPSELIKSPKTKELLDILKEKYDYVVVDCSPVGLVSDAYVLSRLVDVTLFVVRRAKTNKAFFKSVTTQLRLDGINNAALVFNDVKGREGYYGTSRYYGNKSYYLKKNSYYHDDYYEQ